MLLRSGSGTVTPTRPVIAPRQPPPRGPGPPLRSRPTFAESSAVTVHVEEPPVLSTLRRQMLAGAAAAVSAAAVGVVAWAAPALAAPTTLYASPSGTGTTCSSAQPCSLSGAQAAVRSLNDGMSDDIVVQLADGVYRLSAPFRLTAEDSGSNGHSVVWQAAPSARPAISGARAVTGWSVADAGRNIW